MKYVIEDTPLHKNKSYRELDLEAALRVLKVNQSIYVADLSRTHIYNKINILRSQNLGEFRTSVEGNGFRVGRVK